MKQLYSNILKAKQEHQKLIAILVDPEKCSDDSLQHYLEVIKSAKPDFVFVGGSQLKSSVYNAVQVLRATQIPIVLFPGHHEQLCNNADALLMLSLISGRNPEFLIGQQVKAARAIRQSGLQVIPTGYILINDSNHLAVSQVSHTVPLKTTQTELIVQTALAGELLGLNMIYLEAGSGAQQVVPPSVVEAVRSEVQIPLLVGGGIHTIEQALQVAQAGADIIVIGNYFEDHLNELPSFCQAIHAYREQTLS